jgi:3-hydroxyisobutyrate dehydrogenase-like beta-hydroxyacid dehydrogenase
MQEETDMAEHIGFIGTGNMGQPMAHNLLRAGFDLSVYDINAANLAPLVKQGAYWAFLPGDVVEPGGIVITMVPDDATLLQVTTGEDGILGRIGSNGVHLSLSTISPRTSEELAAVYMQQGSTFLGGTVYCRPELAAARKLAILISGPHQARERIRPILTTLGERIFDFGEAAGAANVVKLIANFLLGVTLEAIAEGLALGERNGLDRRGIIDMVRQTLFDGVVFNTYGPMIAHKTYAPARFPVLLGYKDMQLVSSIAARAHVPMPLLNVVHNRLMTCIAHGWLEQDWSSLDRAVLQDAGLDGSASQ